MCSFPKAFHLILYKSNIWLHPSPTIHARWTSFTSLILHLILIQRKSYFTLPMLYFVLNQTVNISIVEVSYYQHCTLSWFRETSPTSRITFTLHVPIPYIVLIQTVYKPGAKVLHYKHCTLAWFTEIKHGTTIGFTLPKLYLILIQRC